MVACFVAAGLWLVRLVDDLAGAASAPLRVLPVVGTVAMGAALLVPTGHPLLAALVPLGGAVRVAWRTPKAAKYMARVRVLARLGWQANRLRPDDVLAAIGLDLIGSRLREVTIVHSPRRRVTVSAPGVRKLAVRRVHPSHWWLLARLA